MLQVLQDGQILCASCESSALFLIDPQSEEVAARIERPMFGTLSDLYLSQTEEFGLVCTKSGIIISYCSNSIKYV